MFLVNIKMNKKDQRLIGFFIYLAFKLACASVTTLSDQPPTSVCKWWSSCIKLYHPNLGFLSLISSLSDLAVT